MNPGGFTDGASLAFPVEKYIHDRHQVNEIITVKNLNTYQQYRVKILQKYDVVSFKRIKQDHPMDEIKVSALPLADFNHAFLLYIIEAFRI